MVIGLTFNQILGALAWAFIAGFITAWLVLVAMENEKEKIKYKNLQKRVKKQLKNFNATNINYNPSVSKGWFSAARRNSKTFERTKNND